MVLIHPGCAAVWWHWADEKSQRLLKISVIEEVFSLLCSQTCAKIAWFSVATRLAPVLAPGVFPLSVMFLLHFNPFYSRQFLLVVGLDIRHLAPCHGCLVVWYFNMVQYDKLYPFMF